MRLNRRAFVGLTASLLATAKLSAAHHAHWLSAFRNRAGNFGVAIINRQGQITAQHRLPQRAHSFAFTAGHRQFAVVARRPGRYIAIINDTSTLSPKMLSSAPQRHFYGHAAYSADGRYLYSSENDYNAERGVIGVRSVAEDYRQIAEWPPHGIGSHEILYSDKTLVIANGGILTHPDSGRTKLNLATMQPSLVRLNAQNGELLAKTELDSYLHQLSIRHIAMAGDAVVFAMQNEGAPDPQLPLVGVWYSDSELAFFEHHDHMRRGYIGSVAVDVSQRIAAATAPRDGVALCWDIQSGKLLQRVDAEDACGVAATDRPGEFMLSSGVGKLMVVNADKTKSTQIATHELQWDNHLMLIN